MRITSLSRRLVAVLASTALLTTGGAASGLLTGTALATILPQPTVTSADPDASNNTATTSVTIRGTNFVPARIKSGYPLLRPRFTGTEVASIAYTFSPAKNQQTSTTALTGNFPLTGAAPGSYDVVVVQQDADNTDMPAAVCAACFQVTSIGPPNVTGVVRGAPNPDTPIDPPHGRGTGALDILGNNFAKGLTVTVLDANGVVDPKVHFVIQNDDTLAPAPPAIEPTKIRGNYSTDVGFTPGKHFFKVTNHDGKTGTQGEFWLPYFTSVSPNLRGAGSVNQIVTVTGSGIRAGSTLAISDLDGSTDIDGADCNDISVGSSTVSADNTTISAPVSLVNSCAGNPVSTAGRAVTIYSPDGTSFGRSNAFAATAAPKVDYPGALVLGRSGSLDATVTGTGFVGGTTFSFGDPKVFAITRGVAANGLSAVITIGAQAEATLGGHSITVTNPDAGTSTTDASDSPDVMQKAPLTINPAPVFTSISPSTVGLGASRTITLKGTDFESPGPGNSGMGVTFSRAGLTASNVVVSQGSNGADDTATFTVTAASNTVPGLSDVQVRNPTDHGTSTCSGCFGVDSLAVSPSADSNVGLSTISFSGVGLSLSSAPYLSFAGGNPDQADIHPAPGTTMTLNQGVLTATFDLTNAAPSKYNAVATGSNNGTPVTLSCSSCFTVTGQPATMTGIRRAAEASTVVKTSAGQGAVDVPVVITGTGFAHGMQLSLQTTAAGTGTVTQSSATIHDVTFVSPTQLTAKVTVPEDAATGAQDIVLSNANGQYPFKYAASFTINPGPKPNTVAPASAGQGAAAKQVTLTGPGFDAASQVSFGPNVTVTAVAVTQGTPSAANSNPDDTLVATINIDEAAATGLRNITVTNPDSGKGTAVGKFTVNAGPKVTSINPAVLAPGGTATNATITGTGFKDDSSQPAAPHPVVTIANVTVTVKSVSADGTSMTVDLAAQTPCTTSATPSCTPGARAVTVSNKTDGGRTSKAGAFTIASLPGAPANVVATMNSAGTSATVTWDLPANDGGSAPSSWVVDEGDNAIAEHTVPASPRSYTFTGLTAGRSYTFTVKAQNVAGTGPAGTARIGTTLTSTRSPAIGLAGTPTTYSGKLTRAGGSALAGKVITLTLTPDIGGARTVNVTTSSTGAWSYTMSPTYSTTVKASFAGTAGEMPALTQYKQNVRTRITRTAPVSGATSNHADILTVTGYTTPNKAGQNIGLRNGSSFLQIVKVASNGSFTFTTRLPAGNYTLNIYIGNTPGNVSSMSTLFSVRRV